MVVGKKVSQGLMSFKGADLTVNFWVGYAHVDSTADDIKSWTEGQGVKVVEVVDIPQRHNRFKSFKLCIRKKDTEKIHEEDFWPEGIILRKFFFNTKNNGHAKTSAE